MYEKAARLLVGFRTRVTDTILLNFSLLCLLKNTLVCKYECLSNIWSSDGYTTLYTPTRDPFQCSLQSTHLIWIDLYEYIMFMIPQI